MLAIKREKIKYKKMKKARQNLGFFKGCDEKTKQAIESERDQEEIHFMFLCLVIM